jgi:predicted MPP superfamily phosphohydrolase
MSKITWLHISDIHLNTQRVYDEKIVLDELLKDINDCIQTKDLQPDFIVVTGDISFSSKPEEYELAKKFFDDLLKATSIPKDRLYIVPGNHDVDRKTLKSLSLDIGNVLTDRSKTNESLGDERERCFILERFHNYQEFINEYFKDQGIHFDGNEYFYVKKINVAGLKIGILGLNSSWLSSSDADHGKLQLGERQIRQALDDSKDVDFRVALLHHPFEWLRDFERGNVDALLIDNCYFILNGHMHRQGILEMTTPDSKAVIIPAGASYESRNYSNSYNFVKLNLEEQNGTIYFRIYSDNRGGFWTLDATSFRNVKDGTYTFRLPLHPSESSDLKSGTNDSKRTSIEPYFGNPYPMKGKFVGRIEERKLLTKWLTESKGQIFSLIAIGGMGKTSLAWAWLHRDVMGKNLLGMLVDKDQDLNACRLPKEARLDGIFWWSFYERESFFNKFIDEALIYTYKQEEISKIHSVQERIKKLVDVLREKRFLIILDGFERELRSYSSLNAAYQEDKIEGLHRSDFRRCTDFNADTFLRWVASGDFKSRILITSRHLPFELDNVSSCKTLELTGLDPDDAIRYVQSMNIKGSKDEIGRICDNYAYHPLALQILVGMIIYDPVNPRDINAANYYDPIPDLRQREHHILELAYNQLKPNIKELLSRVAAFRSSMNYNAIKIINPSDDDDLLKEALRELIDRNLITFDQEQGLYNLHPVIREYAYKNLIDKESIHSQLRDFYLSASNPSSVKSIEDLKDTIELYHHTVKACLYDEALEIYSEKLNRVLYYQLGAFQIIIKLLKGLFPDGEDSPPRLEKKNNQGWVLNSLALCYGNVGQLRHAESIFSIALPFAQNEKDKATAFANLSDIQLNLGELKAAEESLHLKIGISKSLNDIKGESVARMLLSRILAYCGDLVKANKELEIANNQTIVLQKEDRSRLANTNLFLYRTLVNLIASKENPKYISLSLRTARKALQAAKSEFRKQEPILINVKLSLSLALLATYINKSSKKKENIEEAEKYLQEVSISSHNINMLELEPDILIAWSILYIERGDIPQAKFSAKDALFIAERCELRLKQAEIHNFLAQLAIKSNEFSEAKNQALIAYECARCDGPPYYYKAASKEAELILKKAEKSLPK